MSIRNRGRGSRRMSLCTHCFLTERSRVEGAPGSVRRPGRSLSVFGKELIVIYSNRGTLLAKSNMSFSDREEDRSVTKSLCIATIFFLVALAAGCSKTDETANANAVNANSTIETTSTKQGPDN